MGERANVVILQSDEAPPVVLYSHWGGDSFLDAAKRSIHNEGDAGVRIGDPTYFTRKIVAEQIGIISGISTELDDNGYDVLVIDSMDGSSRSIDEQAARDMTGRPSKEWRAIVLA